jgi:hypothetical protein
VKTSPTRRSLELLRARGWTCEIVERWNPHARVRHDLFGCIDIVALTDTTIAGVQTTTSANMAARREKILASPDMRRWIESGGALYVHGWRKAGPRGARKTWQVREEQITLEQFTSALGAQEAKTE